MFDALARQDLATSLGKLVSGEISNDEFDERYYERYLESGDPAVVEIAQFGWGLYSSDVLLPYKLKGRHAVSAETRAKAERAIVFLQTNLEYSWPQGVKGIVPLFCLWGPLTYLGFGAALLTFAALDSGFGGILAGLFGLGLICIPIHWLLTYRQRRQDLEAFLQSGDFDAWPFRSKDELEAAKHL